MLKIDFQPFPCLKTERLILRKIAYEDQQEVFELLSNKNTAFFFQRPYAQNLDDASDFIQKIFAGIKADEWIFWGISLLGQQQLIGTICLWNIDKINDKAEISYELLPDYQKKGYMKEALTAVVTYGFQKMKLKTVEAYTKRNNISSIKLLEKSNFVIDHPTLKEVDPHEWNDPDSIVYKLSNKVKKGSCGS